MPPSAFFRMRRLIGGDSKDIRGQIIYGKSGSWPRLTLVERFFAEGLIESPWVKIGEVRDIVVVLTLRIRTARYSLSNIIEHRT